MTTTEAPKTIQVAASVNVSGDVLNFRGLSVDDVTFMLHAATSIAGTGPSFVVDGRILVVIDEDGITVIGVEV